MVKDGSLVRYASFFFAKKYGTLFLQWYGYGNLVRYAFVVMVRVRYVDTLFELKIPDFLHIVPAFCMQWQRQLKPTLTKCVD